METFEMLKQLLSNKTSETILASATMEDLRIDSLDLVEVLLTVEEQLGIVFEDEELLKLKTVQDVVDLVNSKI
ncbi:MAG: phosphopantetheine-binding protein [Erysipelotrichaceae bacterium]|nr:phosphopantetheine-binding protein [Erysipelotrichaceae bacterium]MDD3923886.1 phosphopantetheine-binding protein [Erysipelotrichaceae bacterium]MDD4642017.1 phosphopantetheine-binding protein [Erysipelotrichaceae bacterium]